MGRRNDDTTHRQSDKRLLMLTTYCEPELFPSSYLIGHCNEALARAGVEIVAYTPMPTRGVTSGQRQEYRHRRAETLLGGMAHVTIVKDDKGTRIKKSSLEALVTHIGSGSKTYRTYKLSDYTPALARANNIHRLAPAETFTIEKLKSIFKRASK